MHGQDDDEENCVLPSLKNIVTLPDDTSPRASCSRLAPKKGSCQVAKELFMDKDISDCEHQKEYKFCQIKGTQGNYTVSCDISRCGGQIQVRTWIMSGSFKVDKFNSSSHLERFIVSLIGRTSYQPGSAFCFIDCSLSQIEPEDLFDDDYDFDLHSASQLLLIPIDFRLKTKKHRKKKMININVLFIDSVSRHHFYRSMPNSVNVFENLNARYMAADVDSVDAPLVLDFRLLQSIKSRTFESFQAFFDGFVNPYVKPFGTLSNPPDPLKVHPLLSSFKQLGYHTLWLEDMCWEWEWGISKNIGVVNKSLDHQELWLKFKHALQKTLIDDMGSTFANCDILRANNVKDHFHGPNAVCFNGRHQHEYHLEYLRNYQRTMIEMHLPYFSFNEINVAHEDTGLRIQTLDKDLAKYLHFASSQKNTLTMIFADHGNSYGSIMDHTPEGQIELFHPMFFVIIPKLVRSFIGDVRMRNLIKNQNRLISILDMHYMLKAFNSKSNDYVSHTQNHHKILKKFPIPPEGLLSEIPANRSCNDIPTIMPNICLCEGFDFPVQNDSQYALIADFVVGSLNNQLLRQQNMQRVPPVQRRCKHLQTTAFQNVMVSHHIDHTIITLDVIVETEVPDETALLLAAVKLKTRPSYSLELMKYDRLTVYGHYSICADHGVDLQLCICSPHQNGIHVTPNILNMFNLSSPLLTMETKTIEHEGVLQECILIIVLKNKFGHSYRVSNNCDKAVFNLQFALKTKNLFVSVEDVHTVSVGPRDTIFLGTAVSYTFYTQKKEWKSDFLARVSK
ncbi:hypothetical protein ScPMuIL_010852 [Solemya velum]